MPQFHKRMIMNESKSIFVADKNDGFLIFLVTGNTIFYNENDHYDYKIKETSRTCSPFSEQNKNDCYEISGENSQKRNNRNYNHSRTNNNFFERNRTPAGER